MWTPEPEALAQLTYSARWRDRDLAGVAIRGNRSRQISLSALASSAVDQRGTLIVSVDGFEGVTADLDVVVANVQPPTLAPVRLDRVRSGERVSVCLLYTSDAADERSSVDLGGRRIIKKKKILRAHARVRRVREESDTWRER